MLLRGSFLRLVLPFVPVAVVVLLLVGCQMVMVGTPTQHTGVIDAQIGTSAEQMVEQGRDIFRYDTFGDTFGDTVGDTVGDEAFWGEPLRLHDAVKGEALDAGLKVDVDALPEDVLNALQTGEVNLDDPATLALLDLDEEEIAGLVEFLECL